jgi:hypothetical protein
MNWIMKLGARIRGVKNKCMNVVPPRCVPCKNLWDSVYEDQPITRLSMAKRVACTHERLTKYQRTDHRPGPGWMSDAYEGVACVDCGAVIHEVKVY